MNTKKHILFTGLAIVMAVMLVVGGGTWAYLQNQTDDVVNTFSANQVTVSLSETTGNDYDIIPGTVQAKDPTVTVNNTVDAYVFVEVTDKTAGLVAYTIADGWQLLEGYDNLYYRAVAADAADKTFAVLQNNQVSYDAALANSDMVNPAGELKTELALTFKATAVQMEPWNNPADAYTQKSVATTEEFLAAIQAGQPVTLQNDIVIDEVIPIGEQGKTFINLNGHTLTSSAATCSTTVNNGQSLTIVGGTLELPSEKVTTSCISVETGATVTLQDVIYNTEGSGLYPRGDAARVNVIRSTINAEGFCIATNASSVENHNVIIHCEDSVFNAVDSPSAAGTAVLVNIPCSLEMDRCEVNGVLHGVVVRGGTAVIRNSTITNTVEGDDLLHYFDNKNWGQGNAVNLAALTVGNKHATSYQYLSNVTLENTKVISVGVYPAVYMWGNTEEGMGADLTYDAACGFTGDIIKGNDACRINGE